MSSVQIRPIKRSQTWPFVRCSESPWGRDGSFEITVRVTATFEGAPEAGEIGVVKPAPVFVIFPDTELCESNITVRRGNPRPLLVDKEMNPRVVMAVGGCDSFAAIKPYLNAPTEEIVDETFAEVDIR